MFYGYFVYIKRKITRSIFTSHNVFTTNGFLTDDYNTAIYSKLITYI